MAQVEKSSVHIKVLHTEAVESKKLLLELQLLSLNTLRNIVSIKDLREQEFKAKREARLKIQDVSRLINEILSTFPVLEQQDISKGIEGFNLPDAEAPHKKQIEGVKKRQQQQVKQKKPMPKKDKKAKLDEELESIKRRLESMQ